MAQGKPRVTKCSLVVTCDVTHIAQRWAKGTSKYLSDINV